VLRREGCGGRIVIRIRQTADQDFGDAAGDAEREVREVCVASVEDLERAEMQVRRRRRDRQI